MKFDTISTRVRFSLRHAFRVSDVVKVPVTQSLIRDRLLKDLEIEAFSFVLNETDMHFVFYYVDDEGQARFTRAKEGMVEFLIPVLRIQDFGFTIGEDMGDFNDVCGRLIETVIGRNARITIGNLLEEYHKAGKAKGMKYRYTFGYKVLDTDRTRMEFNAVFRIHRWEEGKPDPVVFKGDFWHSALHGLYNETSKVRVCLDDVFL